MKVNTFLIALIWILISIGWMNTAFASAMTDDTLVLADSSEFTSVDPQRAGGGFGAYVIYVYGTLIEASNTNYKMTPSLAESWEMVDAKTWKFKIRQGVTFQNGMPFSVHDVEYSIQRQLGKIDPKFRGKNRATYSRLIESVEVPDATTLIIKTKYPDASFLDAIRWIFIVPKAHVEKVGHGGLQKHPIGTGSLQLIKQSIGQSITMKATPNFWNNPPIKGTRGPMRVKKVVVRTIPQEQTRVAALKTGEIHATEVGPDTAKALTGHPHINLHYTSKNQPLFIMYNWRPAKKRKRRKAKKTVPNPFRDKRVRQALIHAIDVDSLIKNYGTGREYRTTLIGKGGIGYNPDVPFYEFNPEIARQLLADAGYPNGFDTKFYVSQDMPPFMGAVNQYLRDVGVRAKMHPATQAVAMRKMYTKRLDGMLIWGAGLGGPDPAANWLKTCVSYDGFWALHGKDAGVESLIKQQAAEFDVEKRSQLIHQITQILWKDAWFVPLWEPAYVQAVRKEWKYEKAPVMRSVYLPGFSK